MYLLLLCDIPSHAELGMIRCSLLCSCCGASAHWLFLADVLLLHVGRASHQGGLQEAVCLPLSSLELAYLTTALLPLHAK